MASPSERSDSGVSSDATRPGPAPGSAGTSVGVDSSGRDADDAGAVVDEIVGVCTTLGRSDLGETLRRHSERLGRPATSICVVGDYKQGKSMLINALFDAAVCPVDDDVATTAFTAVHATDDPMARVQRRVDGSPVIDDVEPDDLWRYATERGDVHDVDLVEIGVVTDVLPPGVVAIDSPGVGGVLDRSAALTLRYLRQMDAVVVVSDASQPLTAGEIEFVERIHDACAVVRVVITKVDLFPQWRRMVELDRALLSARGLTQLDPIPVSAVVSREGRRRDLRELVIESGIPALRAELSDAVVPSAFREARNATMIEVESVLDQLGHALRAELGALDDPEHADRVVAALADASERAQRLQSGAARWSTLLNDRFTDLRTDIEHELRTGMRRVLAEADTRLEGVDPAESWEEVRDDLQADLAALVDDVFSTIDRRASDTNEEIAGLLADEVRPQVVAEDHSDPGVAAIWANADRTLHARRSGMVSSGLAALRGGSSGTILLGMVGRLAGMAVATPAALGVAVGFGAKQVLDVRRRELSQRRQEARTVARRFVDDVMTEAGKRARQHTQDLHRALRDAYAERARQLSAEANEALTTARAAAAVDPEARRDRAERVRAWLTHLDRLRIRSAAVLQVPDDGRTAATAPSSLRGES